MRILILLRGYDSFKKHEVGNFELDQAKALAAAGHDVRAVAVDTRSPLKLRPVGCYEHVIEGIPVLFASYPCGRLFPSLLDALSRAGMKKALRMLEKRGWTPDIVHAHFIQKAYLFSTLPQSDIIPFVITEHSSEVNSDSVPLRRQEQMRLAYQKADRVLAVGSRLKERIRHYTGVEAQVVPNMFDTTVFSYSPGKGHEGGFRFVSAGNLYRIKGFDVLLDAMARLRQRVGSVSLTIIGDGEEKTSLERRTKDLALDGCVRFAGRLSREQMADIYRDADAFVLASRAETFGVAYIEAMASGLPVVATRCGGPEDFVDDTNGILVSPEDPAALAEGMERMIRTADRFDRAGISDSVRRTYSPEALAARLTKIYEEIVKC